MTSKYFITSCVLLSLALLVAKLFVNKQEFNSTYSDEFSYQDSYSDNINDQPEFSSSFWNDLVTTKKLNHPFSWHIEQSCNNAPHWTLRAFVQSESEDPTEALLLLSDLLGRLGKDHLDECLSILDRINQTVKTELLVKEKRMILLTRLNRLTEAQREANAIRSLVNKARIGRRRWNLGISLGITGLVALTSPNGQLIDKTADLVASHFAKALRDATSVQPDSVDLLRLLVSFALFLDHRLKDATDYALINLEAYPFSQITILLATEYLIQSSLHEVALPILDEAVSLDTIELSDSNATLGIDKVLWMQRPRRDFNRLVLQRRSQVYYQLGKLAEAERDALHCLRLLPTDALCSFIDASIKLSTGRFVRSIQSADRVLHSNSSETIRSVEFKFLTYLKEWARYLYVGARSFTPIPGSMTQLSDQFRRGWKSLSPIQRLSDYSYQPGIAYEPVNFITSLKQVKSLLSPTSPHKRDVDCCLPPAAASNSLPASCMLPWLASSQACYASTARHLLAFACNLDRLIGRLHLSFNKHPIDWWSESPSVDSSSLRHLLSLGLLLQAETVRFTRLLLEPDDKHAFSLRDQLKSVWFTLTNNHPDHIINGSTFTTLLVLDHNRRFYKNFHHHQTTGAGIIGYSINGAVQLIKSRDDSFSLLLHYYLTGRQRRELLFHLKSAFNAYLRYGQKALASILMGTNWARSNRTDANNQTIASHPDVNLRMAISEAFSWLYSWILIRPVDSPHGIQIGLALVLGMLRALGLEVELRTTHLNLELDVLMLRSESVFIDHCWSIFKIDWLSPASSSLYWDVDPNELISSSVSDWLEYLNLLQFSNCTN